MVRKYTVWLIQNIIWKYSIDIRYCEDIIAQKTNLHVIWILLVIVGTLLVEEVST